MNQIDGVISVKDLFAELIRKCWLIIICAFVFAIALGGYKLINNLQAQRNVDEVVGELTQEEVEAVEKYVAKVQEQEGLEAYIDDSILLNLNPFNVYRTELQFIITGESDVDKISTIRAAYADYALFGRLASDIAEEYGDYEELALEDIIETDGDIREQDPDLRTVRIMILAKDEEQSEELTACVKEQIAEYSKEVSRTIASHEFELIAENTFHYFKSDLVGKKDYFEEQLENLETEVEMLADQLNATQMSYALELLGEDSEVLDEKDETVKPEIGIKSILKFAILGGVIGVVGSVVLIVAWYFFSNQIKNEKETEYAHEIEHLGNAVIYESKGFDGIADKIFYKEKNTDFETSAEEITSKIVDISAENHISEIVFLGVVDDKVEKAVHSIAKRLEKHHIAANIQTFENIEKIDLPQNIILVETIRKTTVEDVKAKVSFCEEHQLNICGYITFSK